MAIPATPKDKKVAAGGAALALAIGLMVGAAMQPNLAEDGRPVGPQIILGKAALRSTGPFDPRPELASYNGKVPDYVLGTDWARAANGPPPPAAVSPPASDRGYAQRYDARYDPREDEPQPVVYTRYEDDDPPPPPRPRRGRYPSLGGDEVVRILPPIIREHAEADDEAPGDDAG